MKRQRDYSQILIVAALLVTLPRFAGAFIAADMVTIPGWLSIVLSFGMGISGLGMGLLDVLGVAYVFDGWRRTMPRNGQPWPYRYKILTGFVLLMILSGIAILAPFTVARMSGATMNATLGGMAWAWSVCVIAAPYLLIGGIVTGQAGVVTVSKQDAGIPSRTPKAPETPENQIHGSSMHYPCKQCDAVFETIPALATHVRWSHPREAAPEPERVNGRIRHE